MSGRTLLRGLALGVGLAVLPSAAFAVSVNANDGFGKQSRTASYSNGAKVAGSLTSSSGKTVYYSGRLALNNCSDPSTGRYSTNTSSTTERSRGGSITRLPIEIGTCGLQGVKSRVCTVKNNLPDACGSDSARY